MNPNHAATRWSPRQWAARIGFVFGIQLLLIFIIAGPLGTHSNPAEQGAVVRIDFDNRRLDLTLSSDPTLFALAHPESFSGSAWLRVSPPEFEAPDWSEPPLWLGIDRDALAGQFLDYSRSTARPEFETGERAASQIGTLRLTVPKRSISHRSRLTLASDARKRLVGNPPELPVWPHGQPLAETAVELAVSETGEVMSARLLARSGLGEADQHALGLARRFQFAPQAGGQTKAGWTWTTARFHWHTTAPGGGDAVD